MQRRDHPPGGPALDASSARDRATAATIAGRSPGRWPSGLAERLSGVLATDPDATVRAAALGALVRRAHRVRGERAWALGVTDADPRVRLTAARLATHPRLTRDATHLDRVLALAADPDGLVAEQACFALGELVVSTDVDAERVVAALASFTSDHDDPLVREAAVAALGSIGHPSGRSAVLAACHDKPAVRRRAVLALGVYDGPEVDAALQRALEDRDWQVRQAAEDITAADTSA